MMMRKPVEEPVVGICAYMTDTKGFRGILKQRFTDFLVHEVSLEGEVCHLTDPLVPKPSKKKARMERAAVARRMNDVVSGMLGRRGRGEGRGSEGRRVGAEGGGGRRGRKGGGGKAGVES